MRKFLLLTSAVIGFASTAQAAEPIKLEVGGFMNQWFGALVQGDDSKSAGTRLNNFGILSDVEVHFKGSTTLDNGVKVSAVIEKEAERTDTTVNANRNVDQQYVFITSSFGEFSIGEREDVQHRIHTSAPKFAPDWLMMRNMHSAGAGGTPRAAQSVGWDGTSVDGISAAANKIDYISPQLYGFTVAAGYTPTVGGRGATNTLANVHDFWDAVLAYTNKFGELEITGDVGYFRGDRAQNDLPHGWFHGYSAGLKAAYSGFTLGGSVFLADDKARTRDFTVTGQDGISWDVGISYEFGNWGLAFTYYQEVQDGLVLVRGDDKTTHYLGSVKYTMGPGIAYQGAVGYSEFKDETKLDANQTSGWTIINGITLEF
jgi:outer membrane protein OmpU